MARRSAVSGVSAARLQDLAAKVAAVRSACGLNPPPFACLVRYQDDTPEAVAAAQQRMAGSALVVTVNLLANRPTVAA